MTATENLTVTVSAVTVCTAPGVFTPDFSAPQNVSMQARVSTVEAAEALAALFPKSVGVKAGSLRTQDGETVGFLSFNASLVKNGSHGEKNETGIKRFARLLAVAEKNGLTVEYAARVSNAYPTLEAAMTAINA